MKKKDYPWSLLTLVMVAMLSLGLSSCGDDDDELEQTENISAQDPEGTIVLNMSSGVSGNYYKIGELCEIHIDEANNFNSYYGDVSFVSVGLVSGLGKITQIPNSGWAQSAAVVPGTGYVMRCYGQYARIYVVEYLGQTYTDEQGNTYGMTTGAKIKYQAPFQLPIKLDVTSLSFDSKAESKIIELTNPTTITIDEKPEWCEVGVSESSITVSVTENLTAEQRQGDIVLKNISNSVKISVIQKGASSPMFQAGSGTVDDPYQIKTAQQLKSITKALNAHFILTADITLNEDVNGSGWDPIGKHETPFTGTLNGQGHTIKNLWIKRPTTNGVGLFGYINNASIGNVILEISDIGIKGGQSVGGICGYAINNSLITQCAVKGNIYGSGRIGSICGESTVDYGAYIVEISECFSEGNITGTANNYDCIAGIVGYNSLYSSCLSISNCYSKVSLTGGRCDGISVNGSHTKCYYAGKVSNSYDYFYCGGSYTYYDITIIGTNRCSDENNARNTSQMKTQSNYEGWDFTNIWKITEGKTYPTLRCFDK